ncbi:MAG: hypothetical protein KF749_01615 [Bacteroidetes bacterium]|nr:hypothetical protein [Bacteroidota bacterium]MCW5896212.1 hypothetical protein [Bacteroidota bacterium]
MKSRAFIYIILICMPWSARAQREKAEYSGVQFIAVHWIVSVEDRGKTVILEDESQWRICPRCSPSVCRIWPGATVAIVKRDDSYRYPYRLWITGNGPHAFPVDATCIADKSQQVAQKGQLTVIE